MSQRVLALGLALRWAFATAAVLALLACDGGIFDSRGRVGAADSLILLNSLAIMLAVGLPTIVATLVFAWWFRASNRAAKYRPTWVYSGRLEVIVWVIPALVIFFLGGIAWIGSHDLDPSRALSLEATPLEVEVVSLDWKWLFIYPEQGVATINELVLPVGRPVHFKLTSATVMDSFFIPQLGSQIYTMPGMISQLNLVAEKTGTYRGISAQFSGDGFSDMHFDVRVIPDGQFDSWFSNVGADSPLDLDSYKALLKPGIEPTPRIYRSVEAGLFDQAVRLPLGTSATSDAQGS